MVEDNRSAETLLNFVNTASTSVKTVLSKPGCFKRNTNHRRFLLRQLKMLSPRKQSKEPEGTRKTFSISKIRKRKVGTGFSKNAVEISKSQVMNSFYDLNIFSNTTSVLTQPQGGSTMNSTLDCSFLKPNFCNNITPLYSNSSYSSETSNNIINNDVYSGHQFSDFQFPEEEENQSRKFCEMVDQIVDNLLDSSDFDQWTSEDDASDISSVNSPTGSVVSTTSESVQSDRSCPNFMSGEELVESLDMSDIFVPCSTQELGRVDLPSLPISPVQSNFSPLFDSGFRFFAF